MDINNLPPTISIKEAAELLGVGPDAMYDAVRNGEYKHVRVGRRIRVVTKPLLDALGFGE